MFIETDLFLDLKLRRSVMSLLRSSSPKQNALAINIWLLRSRPVELAQSSASDYNACFPTHESFRACARLSDGLLITHYSSLITIFRGIQIG